MYSVFRTFNHLVILNKTFQPICSSAFFRCTGIEFKMTSVDKNFPSEPSVHPMTIAGFNQKTASSYDAMRPDYRREAVDMILSLINLDNMERSENLSADILELGAGTGKFTKAIYCRLKESVKYVATDPMDGFLEQAKKNCPKINTKVCSAENLPFPDSSVRFVMAAQCFHWFASEASVKEIHRVLVPEGKLICLWNNRDISIPWIQAASDLLHEYYTDEIPRAVSGKWKKAFENCTFLKQEFHSITPGTMIKGDKQRIADYFLTISVIASRPEDERRLAKQRFLDIFDKFHPEKSDSEDWILPFKTQVYIYAKV